MSQQVILVLLVVGALLIALGCALMFAPLGVVVLGLELVVGGLFIVDAEG